MKPDVQKHEQLTKEDLTEHVSTIANSKKS